METLEDSVLLELIICKLKHCLGSYNYEHSLNIVPLCPIHLEVNFWSSLLNNRQ